MAASLGSRSLNFEDRLLLWSCIANDGLLIKVIRGRKLGVFIMIHWILSNGISVYIA
ncbi:hypothetical protein [Paenibacillus sp. MER TA 81-3]|uniref:hypothetical protein n=1 Tax=Paenibacillus sp. MER TA 81-3 TaxID=2939573 RepID=UPI00203E033D|nr:hypothetical protein [Paenibacillus sp. MER TA 81-3]